jgi:hypothetical protein
LCIVDQIEHGQAIDDDEIAPDRFARVRRTISMGKRMRFSALPPQASLRVLVRAVTNSLIK